MEGKNALAELAEQMHRDELDLLHGSVNGIPLPILDRIHKVQRIVEVLARVAYNESGLSYNSANAVVTCRVIAEEKN